MAWVSTKEVHRSRSFTAGEKGVRTYKRGWIIRRDTAADTVFIVANTSQLPLPYEAYPEDPYALRLGLDVTPQGDESGMLWEAVATYSNQFGTQQTSNPLQRPPQYSCSSVQYTRPIVRDLVTQKTILNLAGDYYDPPPEVDDNRGQIVVVRNESTLPLQSMNYVNSINSDQFFGNGPRYWKLDSISSGNQSNEGGTSFYPVSYTFTYNPLTWKGKFLEIGYNGKKADGNKIKFNSDKPSLLIARQDNANKTVIGRTVNPDEATFTEWTIYRELPFSVFGFNL